MYNESESAFLQWAGRNNVDRMIASAVRELSAPTDPVLIAAAFFEKTIQIWDPKSLEKISEFATVFCSGARNLAFAPSAEVLVTGMSESHGKLAAYRVPGGALLWERELAYPASLRFHPSGGSVWCSSENKSSYRLDACTGATLEAIANIRKNIEGPYGDILRVPAGGRGQAFRLIAKGHSFEIERLSFALLDAQFSPDAVCLTEAGGPVRCINCADGTQRWRFDPGAQSHVLRLHYSPAVDAFFGILRHLEEMRFRHLMRFDAKTGACQQICDLESWEEVFLGAVDQIVTSAGEIRNLSNGALVGRLPFPVREYHPWG